MNGMAVGAAAAGAPTTEAAAVQVAYDYLRFGMGYLELPLPDGSMIEAENAVFEDRGNGNFLWTGEVPGAGYESVLLTIQDGHLVGWFGEPGGPKYTVHAGPDGRGTLAVEVGPIGDWCGVKRGPARALARAGAAADPGPATVVSRSSHDLLEILLLYTKGAAQYWRTIGGPAVGIQQREDYLNMVFRNGALPAIAHLIPVPWDPEVSGHPDSQGRHFVDTTATTLDTETSNDWHWAFANSLDVENLAATHRPDLVHFVPAAALRLEDGFVAGGQTVLRSHLNEEVLLGWSRVDALTTFAHEIGHNLGANHEPATFSDFRRAQSEVLRPYAFGHTDLDSCRKRADHGELAVCPSTIMSYGLEAWAVPDRIAVREPFYSSARHKPNGWTIGVAGERENELVLRETLQVAVRSGGTKESGERYPRTIQARWTGQSTARVTWSEKLWAGELFLSTPAGGSETYLWNTIGSSSPDRYVLVICDGEEVRLAPGEIRCVRPIFDSDGWTVGLDIEGLASRGSYYSLSVQGGPGDYHENGTVRYIEPRQSDLAYLGPPPPRGSGAPTAPSGLVAWETGPSSATLSWTDHADNEKGFEIWYRKWSGHPDRRWKRYGAPLPAGTRSAQVSGLVAEEGVTVTDDGERVPRGRYSFNVRAIGEGSFGASEDFHMEFLPPPYPPPTVSGGIASCAERSTGVNLDGYEVFACLETPDGARRRAWDHRLEADHSGLLYFFDRDNAEILVKVLDGCGINGHRWVFVAPVTTLAFRLLIREAGPYSATRRQVWYYDSERRAQDRIVGRRVGNPKDRTARTVSDTAAFPCTAAEIAAAKAASSGNAPPGFVTANLAATPSPPSPGRLREGSTTKCEPSGPPLTLRGGYKVSMCYETDKSEVGDAKDWGLDSSQSALLYFFERNNAEVLIKVLDGCGVNGHRWVFVAPVTTLAFNLRVESPHGQDWTHTNRLGRTADARSDVSAFPCTA